MSRQNWGATYHLNDDSRINYAYRDEMAFTDSNLGYIGEAEILDAGLDFYSNSGKWVFSLYGRNLLDNNWHGGDTQLPDTISGVPTGGTFSPLTAGIRYGAEVNIQLLLSRHTTVHKSPCSLELGLFYILPLLKASDYWSTEHSNCYA